MLKLVLLSIVIWTVFSGSGIEQEDAGSTTIDQALKNKINEKFEKAKDAYKNQQFNEAKKLFQETLKLTPPQDFSMIFRIKDYQRWCEVEEHRQNDAGFQNLQYLPESVQEK